MTYLILQAEDRSLLKHYERAIAPGSRRLTTTRPQEAVLNDSQTTGLTAKAGLMKRACDNVIGTAMSDCADHRKIFKRYRGDVSAYNGMTGKKPKNNILLRDCA